MCDFDSLGDRWLAAKVLMECRLTSSLGLMGNFETISDILWPEPMGVFPHINSSRGEESK